MDSRGVRHGNPPPDLAETRRAVAAQRLWVDADLRLGQLMIAVILGVVTPLPRIE